MVNAAPAYISGCCVALRTGTLPWLHPAAIQHNCIARLPACHTAAPLPRCDCRLDAPFGTEDNPVVVPSEFGERIVGVADPDDDSLVGGCLDCDCDWTGVEWM